MYMFFGNIYGHETLEQKALDLMSKNRHVGRMNEIASYSQLDPMWGPTFLQMAIAYGYDEIAQTLLEFTQVHGNTYWGLINNKEPHGHDVFEQASPLYLACFFRKVHILKIMLTTGLDPKSVLEETNDLPSPLELFCQNGDIEILEILLLFYKQADENFKIIYQKSESFSETVKQKLTEGVEIAQNCLMPQMLIPRGLG
jgi:hypothetical protein